MPRDPLNIVGPQVRRLRCERGFSQPVLAAKCQLLGWDVSRDTIAKIEGRRRWAGYGELVFLARSLGVALDALFPAAVRRALRAK